MMRRLVFLLIVLSVILITVNVSMAGPIILLGTGDAVLPVHIPVLDELSITAMLQTSPTVNENCRLITAEADEGNNGTIDQIATYTYDENDNVIRQEFDFHEGVIASATTYTYDKDGNEIMYETDSDGDGIIDKVSVYTYDVNGNRIKSEFDADNDGTVDQVEYFTYDENGNEIKNEYDPDNDGTIDKVTTYT